MNERPEYIKCIEHQPVQGGLWCGREELPEYVGEWVFRGLDHVAYSNMSGSRLVACPECLDAAVRALRGIKEEAVNEARPEPAVLQPPSAVEGAT